MPFPALLFPGQGSQEPDMGRDLAEKDRDSMELWRKAENASKLPLREIYWGGSSEDMAQTRSLQPALTVVNLACWLKLAPKVKPLATAGHSLGEFSAVAAAGVLSVERVLELVSLRGRLMSDADPSGAGAMAAVLKLAQDQVESYVSAAAEATGQTIGIANYNTPGQFVISGTREAVGHVQAGVKAAKGRAVPLAVSGAFHSPLMAEAASEFSAAVNSIPDSHWNKARFPVYPNAEPRALTDPALIRDGMVRQMTSSVYWTDTIHRMWDDGCRDFVECGPKGVLARMVEPILKEYAPALVDAPSAQRSVHNVGTLAELTALSL